ncbi:HAD family hydrolase [Candidatus Halobeggiatoa sp. HSG11]|nr:HAD family hydrolase [Candidatus Halobeggiatoa sp. HSG11]
MNPENFVIEAAKLIRLVVFDVDGVLTDGSLYFSDNGQEYKSFNVRDGLGMVMLQRSGVIIGIITAKQSTIVADRMQKLGIKHVFQGRVDKLVAFEQLRKELQLDYHQIAYVGDDILDIPVMSKVGLAIAVGDANKLVVKHSHWQTKANGGKGAAREVCELIMQNQDTWDSQLSHYGILC